MKRIQLLYLILFALITNCSSNEMIFENAICIQNINTIDPQEGLKENQTVILKDGKIFQIANSNELELSPSNNIVDGTNLFMIPGLWDAHVHFDYNKQLAPTMFDLFLVYGITSVRDTGGIIDIVKHWKDKSVANATSTPRVMIAGPLLDGKPNVYDGSIGRPELSVELNDEMAVSHQIALLDSIGVDFLKAYEMLTPCLLYTSDAADD